LIVALIAGTSGLLVKGLFWLFVLSLCVAVGALIVGAVWKWRERREDRQSDTATT
jgi:hypothetical protein